VPRSTTRLALYLFSAVTIEGHSAVLIEIVRNHTAFKGSTRLGSPFCS
jgi:hypothetical protein